MQFHKIGDTKTLNKMVRSLQKRIYIYIYIYIYSAQKQSEM